MRDDQFRLLWTGISTSKKIRDIQGGKWFRIGCHLVYTWLIPWGDDDGRLRGDPIWVLANILPNEGLNTGEIEKILLEIHRVNLVYWYEIDDERFIQIVDWEEHQSIRKDRYKPSSYPLWQPIDNQLTTNCQQKVNLSLSLSPSPSPSPSPVATAPQKKTKKDFIPPTIDDVINYFQEKGYRKEAAEKAYEYYSTADWKDSKGNQVISWKQKMIGVWFKDENRQGATIKHPNKAEQRDQSNREVLREFAIGGNL